MAKDITMNVDDQMLTCLEIMARGEDMLSMGVWEAPIKRLAMQEFAIKIGNGYRITDKGRAFFAKAEGVDLEAVKALEPQRPNWIVTDLPGDAGLIILRKNELTVSGYEVLVGHWAPVTPNRIYDPDSATIRGDVSELLQTLLDAAWAKGLRPTNGDT